MRPATGQSPEGGPGQRTLLGVRQQHGEHLPLVQQGQGVAQLAQYLEQILIRHRRRCRHALQDRVGLLRQGVTSARQRRAAPSDLHRRPESSPAGSGIEGPQRGSWMLLVAEEFQVRDHQTVDDRQDRRGLQASRGHRTHAGDRGPDAVAHRDHPQVHLQWLQGIRECLGDRTSAQDRAAGRGSGLGGRDRPALEQDEVAAGRDRELDVLRAAEDVCGGCRQPGQRLALTPGGTGRRRPQRPIDDAAMDVDPVAIGADPTGDQGIRPAGDDLNGEQARLGIEWIHPEHHAAAQWGQLGLDQHRHGLWVGLPVGAGPDLGDGIGQEGGGIHVQDAGELPGHRRNAQVLGDGGGSDHQEGAESIHDFGGESLGRLTVGPASVGRQHQAGKHGHAGKGGPRQIGRLCARPGRVGGLGTLQINHHRGADDAATCRHDDSRYSLPSCSCASGCRRVVGPRYREFGPGRPAGLGAGVPCVMSITACHELSRMTFRGY